MALTFNGTNITEVYFNGTRMTTVNFNGTELIGAANGDVTLVLSNDNGGGAFNPGAEDVNRHFVVIGSLFSGSGLPLPSTPTINGTSMTLITRGTSGVGDDGGVCGIYTIKIPDGTSTFTVSAASFSAVTVYRVTGCVSMTSAVSANTVNSTFNGSVASPSNGQGCAFVGTVGNFYVPAIPSPVSSGLSAPHSASDSAHSASNVVTANTQVISTNGNQISSFAVFAYDFF